MVKQLKVVMGNGDCVVYAARQPGAKWMTCSWKWKHGGFVDSAEVLPIRKGETMEQALSASFVDTFNGIATYIAPVTGLPGHR